MTSRGPARSVPADRDDVVAVPSSMDGHRLRSVGQGEPTALALTTGDGDEQTRVMLFAGRPIGESVYASGPFVMNTREEIEQAIADYQRGELTARAAA